MGTVSNQMGAGTEPAAQRRVAKIGRRDTAVGVDGTRPQVQPKDGSRRRKARPAEATAWRLAPKISMANVLGPISASLIEAAAGRISRRRAIGTPILDRAAVITGRHRRSRCGAPVIPVIPVSVRPAIGLMGVTVSATRRSIGAACRDSVRSGSGSQRTVRSTGFPRPRKGGVGW